MLLTLVAAVTIPCSAYVAWGGEDDVQSKSVLKRLERLEQLVEKLLARDANELPKAVEEHGAPLRKQLHFRRLPHASDKTFPREDLQLFDQAKVNAQRRDWVDLAHRELHAGLERRVQCQFHDDSLRDVLVRLAAQAQVNIHLDAPGIQAEGVTEDTPVTLHLEHPVSLRSALNLILEPLNLAYTVRNEVVEISRRTARRSSALTKTYHVADLVIPIPGMDEVGAPEDFAQWTAWKQRQAFGPQPADGNATTPQANVQVDYHKLIDLITTTVAPHSWSQMGGAATIQPFPANLSLVVHQTAEVHEQIADLLEQMRRLLDHQVVVEARFVTVPNDFLETLDVHVKFPIPKIKATSHVGEDGLERIGIGFDGVDNRSTPAMRLGEKKHVLLSDNQMRALMQAVQSERRASILSAPKVTLFNGQRVFLSIGTSRVVKDNNRILGRIWRRTPTLEHHMTSLGLQGVVSSDRRSVRLSVAPLVGQVSGDLLSPEPTEPELKTQPSPETKTPRDMAPPGGDATRLLPEVALTRDVPVGRTLVIYAGSQSAKQLRPDDKPGDQHLILTVTPRIIVREEEEQKLDIESPR